MPNRVTIFGVMHLLSVYLIYYIILCFFLIIVEHCLEQLLDHLYKLVIFSIGIRDGHSNLLSVILGVLIYHF